MFGLRRLTGQPGEFSRELHHYDPVFPAGIAARQSCRYGLSLRGHSPEESLLSGRNASLEAAHHAIAGDGYPVCGVGDRMDRSSSRSNIFKE